VNRKTHQNVFVTSSTKSGRFSSNFVRIVLNIVATSSITDFHLTSIMRLHYLVKLTLNIRIWCCIVP